MIYPSTTGKLDETLRLHTLESVWIQGKLKMWGRWSYIGADKIGNMFSRLLATETVSKNAIRQVLQHLESAGVNREEMKRYFEDLLTGNHKSYLSFCTDDEGMLIDAVIAKTLVQAGHQGAFLLLCDRYKRRMSKKAMARQLNEKHPEWSLRTCESRIDVWLQLAESMLYKPMCDAFDKKPERFRLHDCAGAA